MGTGQGVETQVVFSLRISVMHREQFPKTICLTLSSVQPVKLILVYLFPVYASKKCSTFENGPMMASLAQNHPPQQNESALKSLDVF